MSWSTGRRFDGSTRVANDVLGIVLIVVVCTRNSERCRVVGRRISLDDFARWQSDVWRDVHAVAARQMLANENATDQHEREIVLIAIPG